MRHDEEEDPASTVPCIKTTHGRTTPNTIDCAGLEGCLFRKGVHVVDCKVN